MKARITLRILSSMLLIATVCQSAAASIWLEVGDAGDTLATANDTTGVGGLNTIVGALPDQPSDTNVDMFRIYIPDLSLFSASTNNFPATGLLETWLYLFDDSGLGVAASASSAGFITNATITAGSVAGPAGFYYLAITRFDTVAQSASGDIFPDLFLNSSDGEVLGPTGAGGGDPLAGWAAPSFQDFDNYQIDLAGAHFASQAVVPEPTSGAIWGTLFLGYSWFRRLRRKVPGVSRQ